MKKSKILIILIALSAFLGACSSTDSNGVTISKGWFAQSEISQNFNS